MGSGGAVLDGEGKSAKDVECIVADGGARSQGAMAVVLSLLVLQFLL